MLAYRRAHTNGDWPEPPPNSGSGDVVSTDLIAKGLSTGHTPRFRPSIWSTDEGSDMEVTCTYYLTLGELKKVHTVKVTTGG